MFSMLLLFIFRQALGSASCSSLKQDAGQNALLQKMEDLQTKLKANEQRERAALFKIKMLGNYTELHFSRLLSSHAMLLILTQRKARKKKVKQVHPKF